MFKKVDQKYLEEYAKNDYLFDTMKVQYDLTPKEMKKTGSHQVPNMIKYKWKRALFHTLYGDLLNKKILDVAGAYCCWPQLFWINDYTLLEKEKVFGKLDEEFDIDVFISDWKDFEPKEEYDVVVCCDAFVTNTYDIGGFLEKYLPVCKELRMTVSFHSEQGARGWTVEKVNDILQEYGVKQKMIYEKVDFLPGGRNIYIIFLKGKL